MSKSHISLLRKGQLGFTLEDLNHSTSIRIINQISKRFSVEPKEAFENEFLNLFAVVAIINDKGFVNMAPALHLPQRLSG